MAEVVEDIAKDIVCAWLRGTPITGAKYETIGDGIGEVYKRVLKAVKEVAYKREPGGMGGG